MTLKHLYDTQEDIPEEFRSLFSEKAGKWELTGVTGIRTQADVDRLQAALTKEKNDHRSAREKLAAWEGIGELDQVQEKLDRIEELEAAVNNRDGDNGAKLDEVVAKRTEAMQKRHERELARLQRERDDLKSTNDQLSAAAVQRTVHDAIRTAATKEKLLPTAIDDAFAIGERVFELPEGGGDPVTRDGVGITPGLTPAEWLAEIRERKPHWWPASNGTGAAGSDGRLSGLPQGSENPWSAEGWNSTKQGQLFRQLGAEKAGQLAKLAGTSLGGPRPRPKPASA